MTPPLRDIELAQRLLLAVLLGSLLGFEREVLYPVERLFDGGFRKRSRGGDITDA